MLLKPTNDKDLAVIEVLSQAGISSPVPSHRKSESNQGSRILEDHGFSKEIALLKLAELAKYSDEESIRYRATVDALKIHGVMREDAVNAVPSFTVIIENSNVNINQVLIPRE